VPWRCLHESGESTGRQRLCEQEALRFVAVLRLEEFHLRYRLDALGDHVQPKLCAIAINERTIETIFASSGSPRTKFWSILIPVSGIRVRKLNDA
jgi:hypothetical protein